MIPLDGQVLLKFVPIRVEGKLLSREELKTMAEKDIRGTPVVIKLGAVDFRIGRIHFVRVGRDQAVGDIRIELEGSLELGPVKNEEGEVIGAKPTKYVFKRTGG